MNRAVFPHLTLGLVLALHFPAGTAEAPRAVAIVGATIHTMSGEPIPEGTVLLKAQHGDAACQNLDRWTVMRKGATGSAPDGGDWEWQVVDGGGDVKMKGQLAMCVSCHSGTADTDWVFTSK